jgi:hypothetical protein
MAEVSPVCPIVHPKGCTAKLAARLITPELAHRSSRPADHAGENAVLVALARMMAHQPDNLLQSLVEQAISLCRAGTAGICVLKTDAEGEYFSVEALAGALISESGRYFPSRFPRSGPTTVRTPISLVHFDGSNRCPHDREPGGPAHCRWAPAWHAVDHDA